MSLPAASISRTETTSKLFAYSRRDAFPAVSGVLHLAYIFLLFWLFPRLPWWAMLPLGLVYSIAIAWNINSISHNFIHNPYFRSPLLNRAFSWVISLATGASQVFIDQNHLQHHKGNADRPDENGETLDWVSIYKHGHDGEPENPWAYIFLSFFREDPKPTYAELKRRNPADARWGLFELISFVFFFALLGIANWRFIVFFLPFWYFGHCLSYVNGYYMHYGANPDMPIAWGVSTYGRIYNWLWFNNGFHAEHHFRPKIHWTKMKPFRELIREEQEAAPVRVIRVAHTLGFLDRSLPPYPPLRPRPASEASVSLDS